MTQILIDGRLLSDNPTGISRYTQEIIKALLERYGQLNITVLVSENLTYKPDCPVITTKLKPYNPLHFILFPFFINRLEFSIYYSTFYSGLYFLKAGRKQILTVHDLMYLRIEKYFSNSALWNWLSKALMNAIVRLSLRASDLVISVSQTTQNDVKEFFHQDSVVIGEGVNQLEERPDEADQALKKWNLEKEKFFLYVGNYRKQKNSDFLLEAFVRSNSPHQLVMVGASEKIKSQKPNIIFTGVLKDHEIQTLYKNCLTFVLPSLYEGFGLSILEAYTAGARVFTSNRGALKEFGDLRIKYFSPDNLDELVQLLQDAENSPRQNNSDIVHVQQKYSWKKQTDQLLESINLLKEVTSGRT